MHHVMNVLNVNYSHKKNVLSKIKLIEENASRKVLQDLP